MSNIQSYPSHNLMYNKMITFYLDLKSSTNPKPDGLSRASFSSGIAFTLDSPKVKDNLLLGSR